MKLDLLRHPFSTAGSYLVLSQLTQRDLGDHRWDELRLPDGLYLRHVHGAGEKVIARLDLLHHGRPLPATWTATPEILRARTPHGQASIQFISPTRIVFTGNHLELRFRIVKAGLFGFACRQESSRWLLNHFITGSQFHLLRHAGSIGLHAPWDGWKCSEIEFTASPAGSDPHWSFELEELVEQAAWIDRATHRTRLPGFSEWLQLTPTLPAPWSRGRELAAYVQWVSLAGPRGLQFRPGMLMSKNWMPQIWSWDHCFNAMALIRHQPALAWDNLMVIFDHQAANGKLPDTVTDLTVGWNYTKVPIHGWAFEWMRRRSRWIRSTHIAEFYPKLAAWTRWWFEHRDTLGEGLPHYNHGNDGWDNATPFKIGMPVQSPELCAYLILQLDALTHLSRKLGRLDESRTWKKQADALLSRWLTRAWNGERFTAPQAGTGREHPSQSLLLLMPLALGARLPAPIRRKLIATLRRPGGFLTRWGVATESLRSDQYEADGYWRGPIWAPCMMLLVDGLARAGETTLARDLARRFCKLFLKSGAAENYHAETGAALRDPCYSWSASVFLILASEYA